MSPSHGLSIGADPVYHPPACAANRISDVDSRSPADILTIVKRTDTLCLLALLGIQLAFFQPSTFAPSRLLASRYSDVITQHLPHQIFIRDSLLNQRSFPLWNPLECAGTPAFPNPLYFTLAFPHLLLTPLPPAMALNLGFFIHIALAGIATYCYARRTGCGPAGSLLAAIAYSLGLRSLSHIQVGFYSRAIFFAYIPLLFLAVERCCTRPSPGSSLLMGIFMSLALLSGEPQLFIYVSAFLALYALLRTLFTPAGMGPIASTTKSLACVLAGIILFLLIAAFYLVPAARLGPLLTRVRPIGEEHLALMPTLPQLASLFTPGLVGEFSPGLAPAWESALYIGIVPSLLIIRTATRRASRRDFYLWGALMVVALLLSLRGAQAIHATVSRLVPALASFRNPGRTIYLAPFFASVLAGRGLHSLLSARPHALRRTAIFWLCALLAGAMLLICTHSWLMRQDGNTLLDNYCVRFSAFFGKAQLASVDRAAIRDEGMAFAESAARSLRFQFAMLLAACGFFVFTEIMPLRGPSSLILVAATAADLFYFGGGCVHTHPLREIYPPSALREMFGKGHTTSRLLDMSSPFAAAFWTAFPFAESTEISLSRVDGYTPVNLDSYARFIEMMTDLRTPYSRWSLSAPSIAHPELLSLLNAELILSTSILHHAPFRFLDEFNDLRTYKQFLGSVIVPRLLLYENIGCMPGAWLVPAAEGCAPGGEEQKILGTDPRQKVILAPGAKPLSGGESYRPVPLSRRGPNAIALECETSRPAYLCTSEIWTPGWIARDCGRPVEVARINMIFRGIYLPPGKHSIAMNYRPPGLRMGAAISGVTAATVLMIFIIGRRCKSLHSPRSTVRH